MWIVDHRKATRADGMRFFCGSGFKTTAGLGFAACRCWKLMQPHRKRLAQTRLRRSTSRESRQECMPCTASPEKNSEPISRRFLPTGERCRAATENFGSKTCMTSPGFCGRARHRMRNFGPKPATSFNWPASLAWWIAGDWNHSWKTGHRPANVMRRIQVWTEYRLMKPREHLQLLWV